MVNLCGMEMPDSTFDEELSLIIDNPKLRDEAEWEYARSFMKRVGLKSDSVGWCNLENPSTDKLREIFALAREEKVTVRGIYEMKLKCDLDSEWYLVDAPKLPANLDICRPRNFTVVGKEYTIIEFADYLIPSWVDVSDDITDAFGLASFREDIKTRIEEFGVTGGRFTWIPDCGKYEAPQFFSIECEHFTPECYENNRSYGMGRSSTRFDTMTDCLRTMNDGCKELHITLPIGINKSLMPKCDFCGVRLNTGHRGLLISKRLRDFIIRDCGVKTDRFRPVLCFDGDPTSKTTPLLVTKYNDKNLTPPTAEERAEIERLHKIHLAKKKPKRVATEKIALQKLKDAKKGNPELFGKRASAKAITVLPNERLTPYCKVADGGAISDEYRFLSIEEMHCETKSFYEDYALENAEAIPDGAFVFALAADGEYVLLLPNGSVIRYVMGCESPDIVWKSLEEFFCEAIE